MKALLNWQEEQVVNLYDEAPLWSAPFGKLLLENMPMKSSSTVLDLGFGTGFPLIELAQRFGDSSNIIGIDLWHSAIERARKKIATLQLNNITIIEQSADAIPLKDSSVDLCCSNLGINNFEKADVVLGEVHRVLKASGNLCITTNPIGTFEELMNVFEQVLDELKLPKTRFTQSIQRRGTAASISQQFQQAGFIPQKSIQEQTSIRFTSAQALFDYGLIRIGFRESWEQFIPQTHREHFFQLSAEKVNSIVREQGEFKMSIPILYLEFKKQ